MQIKMEFIKDDIKEDYLLKFMILGLTTTGKTDLINRINLYNDFSEYINSQKEIRPTIGVDFKILRIKYKNIKIKIQFWDTSGSNRFEHIASSFMRGCSAFFLCYDAYNKDSFIYIKNKYFEVKNDWNRWNNAVYALIRNKYDLKTDKDNKDIVSDEEALEFADNNNIIFGHVSSFEKYENGIIQLFELILDKVIYNKNE